MRQIRTDLAMESAHAADKGDLNGVSVSTWEMDGVNITEVKIEADEGARLLKKPRGTYLTLECGAQYLKEPQGREALGAILGEELSRLVPEGDQPVLVVGLGNRHVTPDALGPMTVDRTLVTRHIFRELPDSVDERMCPVCAIAPGVLGVTGIETLEMLSGVAQRVTPRAVIAVDALAARATGRIGTTIQLTDTGIQPGSGVGNHRRALTRQTLGVPVIAIGVPMVIYAATIVRDALEQLSGDEAGEHAQALDEMTQDLFSGAMGEMIVTPREVDDIARQTAAILADGINRALHPQLSGAEIKTMME